MGRAAQAQPALGTDLAPHGLGQPAGESVGDAFAGLQRQGTGPEATGQSAAERSQAGRPVARLGRSAHGQRQRRVRRFALRLAEQTDRLRRQRTGGEVIARFGGEGDDGPVMQRLRGAPDNGARVGDALPVEHFGHERSAFALKKDGRETNVVRSESRFDKRAA